MKTAADRIGETSGVPTAADFLDELRVKFVLSSDYQLAKLLHIKPQQISTYRRGKHTFDDDMCSRIGELLGRDAGYIAACMSFHRAKSVMAKGLWASVASIIERNSRKAAGTAVAVLLAFTALPALDITEISAIPGLAATPSDLYIMRMLAAALALAAFLLTFSNARAPRATVPVR